MKVRIALAPGGVAVEQDDFAAFIDGLESHGVDTVWLSDVPLGTTVDALVGLALAAGRTQRLKLGANVVVPGRNPLLLAKELAQLDRLSGGRLLLSFVPGLNTPADRASLGVADIDRGALLSEVIGLCRRWWAGETADYRNERFAFSFPGVSLRPLPVKQPLEVWLGGIAPAALRRAGRVADGWLTARATPAQAGAGRAEILAVAAAHGRHIDPEHFGISIPYSRLEPPPAATANVARQNPDVARADILPVGPVELVSLLRRHIEEGMSKFVLRPMDLPDGWPAELDWLAEHVLPLQT